MENWKPVPGFEGLYQVSDRGNVLSESTHMNAKRGILTPDLSSHGYPRVSLHDRGTIKRFQVHRLVMLAFVGPAPEGQEVNHINGVKSDPRLENLEYVTRRYNQLHCNYVIKTREPQKGSKHGMHKLNEEKVLEIRSLQGKLPMKDVAQRFGVNIPSVCLIWNRKTWRHI